MAAAPTPTVKKADSGKSSQVAAPAAVARSKAPTDASDTGRDHDGTARPGARSDARDSAVNPTVDGDRPTAVAQAKSAADAAGPTLVADEAHAHGAAPIAGARDRAPAHKPGKDRAAEADDRESSDREGDGRTGNATDEDAHADERSGATVSKPVQVRATGRATPRTTVRPITGRRRGPLWAKVLVVLGALIMILGIGAIGLVGAGLSKINGSIEKENLLGGAAAGTTIDGPLNILLVGSDLRANQKTGGHSDTIIIVHIPASHDRAYLISIPRDTGVRIPAFSKTGYPGGSAKINAAYTFGSSNGGGDEGGFQLLAQTIKDNYGITFNGGAIVDFSGFKDILDKLGGVWMYVDETTYSIHYGVNINTGKPAKPYNINPDTGVPNCQRGYTFNANPLQCALPGTRPNVYHKGYQHLTPAQALDFVRARDGLVGTDYARQRHQQQFIKAVVEQAYSQGLNNPLKLESFVGSLGKALIIDSGVSVTDWIFTLKGLSPKSIVAIKTNDGQTVDYDGSAGPIPGSVQSLNSDSKDLLAAIVADKSANDDNVGLFLQSHPDWATN